MSRIVDCFVATLLRWMLLICTLAVPVIANGHSREKAIAITQVSLYFLKSSGTNEPELPRYACEECQDTGFVGDQNVPCQFCEKGQAIGRVSNAIEGMLESASVLVAEKPLPGYTRKAAEGPSLVIISGDGCLPCLILKQKLSGCDALHVCTEDYNTESGKAFMRLGIPDEGSGRMMIPQVFLISNGKIRHKFGSDAKSVLRFVERLKGVKDLDAAILDFLDGERKKVIKTVIEEGSQRKAALKLGKAQSTVAGYVNRAKVEASRRGYAPEFGRTHGIPSTEYITGVSSFYDGDGNLSGQWVKTKASSQKFFEQLECFTEQLTSGMDSKFEPVPAKKLDFQADVSTHIKIGDQHLGLYAWGQETNSEDYGLNESTRDVIGGIKYLIDSSIPCESLVLVNVGDFFHADDHRAATPQSGNALDVDTRHGKVARRGAHILKTAIELALEKHANVEVINARGNHDPNSAVWVGVVLDAYFSNEPRVKIHRNDSKWLHWVFGKTAVFVNHGEKKPIQQYEYITNRYRDIIGKCDHIYVDNGHIHHKESHEIGAAKFEVWNPLTAVDAYHADNSYGASRSITSVSYHKEYGEVSRNVCDFRMIRDLYS